MKNINGIKRRPYQRVYRQTAYLFIIFIFASCYGTEPSGQNVPLNLAIISKEILQNTLPVNEYVLSIAITGKKYSAYRKTSLHVSKVVFPAVPLDEEIKVTVFVFPVGAKTGKPQLWYGVYPEDKKTYKVEPAPQTIPITLQAADSKANGGTIYFIDNNDGSWDEAHIFTETGSSPQPLTFGQKLEDASCVLIVGGGGGGGGANTGGGGGGGGVLFRDNYKLSALSYNIEVGSGGAGGSGNTSPGNGVDGKSSVIKESNTPLFTAFGGGGGGGGTKNGLNAPTAITQSDVRGGGGGGGGGISSIAPGLGGTSTGGPGNGKNGGDGSNAGGSGNNYSGGGGGGGGMGSIGIRAADNEKAGSYGGYGGAGISSEISGKLVFYGGGGGGGGTVEPGSGGRGGGGKGAVPVNPNIGTAGENGTNGLGGGGGGGMYGGGGGKGGSGVVIIRFPFSLP